jgi:hypothetical protein
MIHSKNFLSVAKHRKESWDPLAESLAISGVPLPTWLNGQDSSGYATAEGPLIAQFCGDDPSKVSAAARYVIENGVDGVDLNLGCPQAIARKGHYGAYLLREPELVQKIVSGDCFIVPKKCFQIGYTHMLIFEPFYCYAVADLNTDVYNFPSFCFTLRSERHGAGAPGHACHGEDSRPGVWARSHRRVCENAGSLWRVSSLRSRPNRAPKQTAVRGL